MPTRTCRLALAGALTLLALTARADYPLEILDLKARLPEDLIPALQPLVGPGGVITGSGHSLFVRAAPERLADIRRALARLDTPARSLMIQVRRAGSTSGSGSAFGAAVDEPLGDRGRIRVGPGGTGLGASTGQGSRETRSTQEVRALDGRPAFIAVGTERPEVWREGYRGPGGSYSREGVSYRSAETGFFVTPRVNGDQVTLDIGAFTAQPSGRGALETGDIQTSLSARLGEWVPIGGAQTQGRRSQRGLVYGAQVQEQGNTEVEIRVIEVR